MPDIFKLAEELGKAISQTSQAAALRTAREELNKDPQASKLLDDFKTQTEKIIRLQREKKPVEVDDKHRLQEIHDKLVSCPSFKKAQAAEVEYADLTRRVNRTIAAQLADTERGRPSQAAGS